VWTIWLSQERAPVCQWGGRAKYIFQILYDFFHEHLKCRRYSKRNISFTLNLAKHPLLLFMLLHTVGEIPYGVSQSLCLYSLTHSLSHLESIFHSQLGPYCCSKIMKNFQSYTFINFHTYNTIHPIHAQPTSRIIYNTHTHYNSSLFLPCSSAPVSIPLFSG